MVGGHVVSSVIRRFVVCWAYRAIRQLSNHSLNV